MLKTTGIKIQASSTSRRASRRKCLASTGLPHSIPLSRPYAEWNLRSKAARLILPDAFSVRGNFLRFLLGALLLPILATPAAGQSAAATVARAQQTLDEMSRLIDGIHARAASPGSGTQSMIGAGWQDLFDGASLAGWKRTDFGGGGAARVEKRFRGGPAAIVVDAGTSLSGINWEKDAPRTNYEIAVEALKIQGGDFMLGLTFPVGDAYASLILGGWGGTVTGISSVDGHDASENETSRLMSFEAGRWFAIRMRITPAKLEAWIDGKKIVDEEITGKRISLRRGEIAKSVPIGLATYQTSAAYRAIRLRRLDTAATSAHP